MKMLNSLMQISLKVR